MAKKSQTTLMSVRRILLLGRSACQQGLSLAVIGSSGANRTDDSTTVVKRKPDRLFWFTRRQSYGSTDLPRVFLLCSILLQLVTASMADALLGHPLTLHARDMSSTNAVRAEARLVVDPVSGNDTSCIAVPSVPCKTLERALDSVPASVGSVFVKVFNGTLRTCNVLVQALSLDITPSCPVGVAASACRSILDCSGCHTCLIGAATNNVILLQGFSIVGSTQTALKYYGSLEMYAVSISQHTGALLEQLQSANAVTGGLVMQNCSIFNNSNLLGLQASIYHLGVQMTIQNTVFYDNVVRNSTTNSAPAFIRAAPKSAGLRSVLLFRNCSIRHTVIEVSSGRAAVIQIDSDARATFESCKFSDNAAGAVVLIRSGDVLDDNSRSDVYITCLLYTSDAADE